MSCTELDAFTFDRHILDEADIKAIVLNELRRSGIGWQRAVVANEFRLATASVRADLAVFGTDFVGIEIKSERDNLKRLSTQVAAYSKYFDRVIVAVSAKHVSSLNWKALHKADVWSISESGRISIVSERSELPEAGCLSDLLTFAQRDRYGLNCIENEIDSAAAFEVEFRKRFGETSNQFWDAVGGRPVRASDLGLLSRFRDRRETISAWARDQEMQWTEWASAMNQEALSAL